MVVIEGDLIQLAVTGEFDVIVHGANCQNTMGSGIARQIKEKLPEAFHADTSYGLNRDPEAKLGRYSCVEIERKGVSFYVVNAYTQLGFGPGLQISYQAIEDVFRMIARDFRYQKIGYPKIGAGLGGGDWERIAGIIESMFQGMDHTLVEFKP